MRRLLTLAAALVLAAPAAAADLPAVVIHVKPVGALLDDVRAGAKLIGGPDLAKQFDDYLKKELGEKGLTGLDPTRPIVGYARMNFDLDKTEKAEDFPAVFAVPVTSEEAFVDFINRTGKGERKATPVAGKKGTYKLPAAAGPDGAEAKGDATVARVLGGYAYVTKERQAVELDDGKLVTADKLAMPGETALFAMKMTFDRLPSETQKKIGEAIDKAIAEVKNTPFAKDEKLKEVSEEAEKKIKQMMTRWLGQVKEAKDLTFRLVFDPKTGEAGFETALAAKPGTSLAKDLASWKPHANRFAGLVGKDAVGGALWSFVFVNPEIRDFFAMATEAGAKQGMAEGGDIPPFAKPLLKEVTDGMARTVKAGQIDLGAALTGPDKNGLFTAVGGFSFEDPAKVEKELRTLVAEQAPPEVKNLIKFDAGKAGATGIHKITPPPGQLPPEAAKLFGESAAAAVAFAPKGVYVAFGPDPVAALQTAVAAQPQEARLFELKLNAAKIGKLAEAVGGPMAAAQAAQVLGDKDDLYTVFYVGLDGGDELRVQIGMNVKLAGGFVTARGAAAAPPEKK